MNLADNSSSTFQHFSLRYSLTDQYVPHKRPAIGEPIKIVFMVLQVTIAQYNRLENP